MQKYIILLAGCPCTGKTYLTGKIQHIYKDSLIITPDEGKELYADSVGFSSLQEKSMLEKSVWSFFYGVLDLYMTAGKRVIISEYPFSNKQKKHITKLTEKYGYNIITLRLIADFEVLWQRRYKRDREPERHLSHIMTHYHYGDVLEDRCLADGHITKEQFYAICFKRKYDQFELGETIEIEVSDFNKVDYTELLNYLQAKINTSLSIFSKEFIDVQ